MKIIETHCHLDYLEQAPIEEILEQSKKAGIEKIITISVEPDNFDKALELTKHENVFCSQGIHPHDAKLSTPEFLKIISERCSHPKVLAVGEIGLDYHYNNSPPEIQREVFKAQLDIAIEKDMPVIIHSRDADDDMIYILKEKAPLLKKKGVIHSFTSGAELAQTAIDLGFYLGFNGIITFKKAEDVRNIVRLCPTERILLETDAPFLTPVPHRGKENAPFYLVHILEKVAELKDIDYKELEQIAYNNSLRLFFK